MSNDSYSKSFEFAFAVFGFVCCDPMNGDDEADVSGRGQVVEKFRYDDERRRLSGEYIHILTWTRGRRSPWSFHRRGC
jgi:hypothetical protein